MKTLMNKAAALLLAALLVLGTAACGEAPAKTEPAPQPAKTEADTKAPSTEPLTTEVPTSEPPASEAPATLPETAAEPTAEPPTTEPPTTEELTTAAPALASGRYDLFDLPLNGGTEAAEQYAANGLYFFLVIEDGGKGYIHRAGEEKEISWNEKSISIDGSDASYKAEDGVITLYSRNQPYMLFRLSEEAVPERGETMKRILGLYRTDEIVLKDEVLIDNNEFSVTADEIVPPKSKFDGYTLKLTATNKTVDDSLGFFIDHAAVNGITIRLRDCGTSAKKGDSRQIDVRIDIDDMKLAGTGDPTRIDLYLHIKPQYDPHDKFLDYVTVYPLGKDKAEMTERQAGEKDQVLEDNDKVGLTYVGMREQSSIGYAFVTFWVENKTDQTARASLFINSINGADARVFGETALAPHSSGILEGIMNLADLNGLTLEQITDFGLSFDLDTDSVNPKTIAEGNYSFKP